MTIKTLRRACHRSSVRLIAAAVAALLFAGSGSVRPTLHAQGPNPTSVENNQPGDTDWDISGAGDPTIQGFATDISVNTGGTVSFKVKTDAPDYKIHIYRLGYYRGAGARRVATVTPSAALPQTQPACLTDASTGLIDCGNWSLSASWTTTGAVSGIYVAKLVRTDYGGASHMVFIVRDDTRQADVLVQSSDTTWQAYNRYGGVSTYCAPSGIGASNAGTAYDSGACPNRATKVSYNRPIDTRANDPQSFVFNAEYPMLRWLEANGYDVKYWAGVDTDRRGADLVGTKKPKVFLSSGHDEYWSGDQRTTIENARNAGVNLAFFSGNEMFWKTRYEPSVDGSSTAYRTLVTYKETLASAKIDPAVDGAGGPIWTGTWRDPRFSPPADGGRPENGVTGTIWTVNSGTAAMTVPAAMAPLRFWQNTRVAALTSGVATLSPESVGYEWDEALDNGARPSGLVTLSSTTVTGVEKIIDYGATVGRDLTATHSLTLYRHNSGALVFGAGTVQWSWGLDSEHDRGAPAAHVPDQAMQQATVNLLADMGAQPGSLQIGADPLKPLMATAKSTDIYAPTSVITSPAAGVTVDNGNRVTINGTATDNGGGVVASVEVSVDGGTTWRGAAGTTTWSFDWSPGTLGSATIRSRSVDDSGNLEAAGAGVTVSVIVGACPCPNLWKPAVVPVVTSSSDNSAVELGVKFKSDIAGFITGVRFYKGAANSGTHAGNLWSANGTRLATAVFTSETTSGWQQVSFGTPVAITANTTYVASYHTNVGGYSADGAYFANTGVDSPPLHALPSATSGGNGVYQYGATGFPTNSFNATNYWVDVVFAASLSDTTPPVISAIKATTIDSARETITWSTDEEATSRIDYGTNPAILTDTTLPPGTLTLSNGSFVVPHSAALVGLQPNTTYYYRVTAADRSGNTTTVAAPSFTVPGPTLRDTASTDFAAGTKAGTYVSQTADGEVILAPTSGSEFTGPALPAGWIEVPWSSEGYSIIANGVLLVDGARVASCVTDTNGACLPETTTSTPSAVFTAPRSLEFTANFSGDQFQHAGFAQTFASTSEPWAIFSTLSGGLLFARTNPGGCVDANGCIRDTGLGTGLLGAFHHYRIDWKINSVDYYVDGALVVSHPLTVTAPMRPVAASDYNPFGGTVFVDWMRMSPYAGTGSFVSRIFDASSPVNWNSIQWAAKAPAGTGVAIGVRTGNTPTPDATWSAFVPVAAPGPLALTSQFIQYQAVLTSSDPNQTPALEDIIISTGHAPVAVADSAIVAENGSHTFPASGPGSLTFNDTDADFTDTLRVVAVTTPAHGTATVTSSGAVIYTPDTNYSGSDAFIYTVSDGLLTSSAPVTLDVRFGNIPPVATSDFYGNTTAPVSMSTAECLLAGAAPCEDTLFTVAAPGILANDTDVEHDPLTVSLVTIPAHGTLTLSANGAFSYQPVLNYSGPDAFAYKANDGTSDSNVATVQLLIHQVNDAPITEADAFTAVLDQPLDVPAPGVLRNDHDVEVEDTVPLHAQLVSGPAHGQLIFRTDGSFSYVPDLSYLGTDAFTYAAVDHFGAIGNPNTVTLTVAIKAVSTVIAGGGTVSTGTGVSSVDPLQSAVTSPTNATVAIAQGVIAASSSPSGYTYLNQQVNITITGADGTEVTAAAANPIKLVFTIDRSLLPATQDETTFQMFRNGILIPDCLGATTIPAANSDPCVTTRESGPALNNNVRLTIVTSHASHWNMGVSTAALGDLPVAVGDGGYLVNFQEALVVSAPGVLRNDYGKNSLTAVLSGVPTGGTVNLAPSGGFTFTPATGFCGTASFNYKALDGSLESNQGTASLVIDCTPRAVDDATTVLEDSGASTITVLSNDSDPDPGQSLSVTTVIQGAHGAVAIAGAGKWVTYAPQQDFFGSDSFTYTISDGHNGSATATVHVTVTPVNDAPSFTKGVNETVSENAGPQSFAWATTLSAGPANESGQALSFTASNSNSALFTVAGQPTVAANGTLTFTSAPDSNGSATVTVQIHDDGGSANGGVDTSAAQTFAIYVTPVNSKPAATSSTLAAIQGVATALALSGSDLETTAANLIFTVGSPAHGTLSGTAPNLTYQPVAGYTGPDSLTYTVTDAGDPTGCGAIGLLCAAALTSDPATVSITVVKADSTTALQTSANPSVYGTSITLTATITPVPAGSDVPGGSMTFMDGATVIGSASVSAGVATLTTSALTAGSHAITAVYSGDSNFNASTSSSLTQNVTKAPATVTAGGGTKVYGTSDLALSATTQSGFTAADAPIIMLGSTRASGEAAGSYPTTATATGPALSNYTVAYVAGTFSITKASATVTAGGGTKVYGTSDPALSTTTQSGFTAADAPTIMLGSTRASGEAAGSYATTATATGPALSNYTVAYVAGTFSITKASATVRAGGGTKVYGASDPALSATTQSGFTAGDALTITLSSTRASGEAAGSYATTATATGAPLSNYTVAYVAGTFSITKATTATALVASSTSFRFGAPLTLTATVTVVAPGAGAPTGSVTFMDGASALGGPVTVNAGVATLSTSSLAVGTHAVTALYNAGTNFTGSASSPTTITVNPDLTWVNTTAADFSAGTLDAGVYVSQTAGGEMMLKPALATEFSGTALPAGWISTANITGGTAVVGNGVLTLQGAQITSTTLYGVGRSLEFSATFFNEPDQTVGLLLAQFNTKTTGSTASLYARTITNPIVETLLPGNWFNQPHKFRIDWNASNIVYWIDGVVVATHNVAFSSLVKMTVIASDWKRNDLGKIVVDWMRLTPYAASGTYTSKAFDAGIIATWMNATWTAAAPAGTGVVVSYRTGNTPTPDGTWTAFTTVPASGGVLSGQSRYMQFKIQESTTNPSQTSVVNDLTVIYR